MVRIYRHDLQILICVPNMCFGGVYSIEYANESYLKTSKKKNESKIVAGFRFQCNSLSSNHIGFFFKKKKTKKRKEKIEMLPSFT